MSIKTHKYQALDIAHSDRNVMIVGGCEGGGTPKFLAKKKEYDSFGIPKEGVVTTDPLIKLAAEIRPWDVIEHRLNKR